MYGLHHSKPRPNWFPTDFMTMTSGSGLLYHTFDHYGLHKGGKIGQRKNGVLVANATGKALTNALFNLQESGRMFIAHGTEVYEGMIIGIHTRENDLNDINAIVHQATILHVYSR
jgi:GTP-binding protein